MNVVAAHDTKKQRLFRTIAIQGKNFFAMTNNGVLITSRQLIDAVRQSRQNLVEFSQLSITGLTQDAYITSLLAIQDGQQTRLLIGVVTEQTKTWLYQTQISEQDTDARFIAVEGNFEQVLGLRYQNGPMPYIVLATGSGQVWVAENQGKLNFIKMFDYPIGLDETNMLGSGGFTSDLAPPAHTSQPGRA